MLGLACENRTNLDFLNGRVFNLLADFLCEFFTGMGNEFTSLGMVDVVDRGTTKNFLAKALDNILALLESGGGQAAEGSAVFLIDNHIVGHVDQTTGQVTSVSRLQSGIGKTLTGTVGRDEVLEHRQTFLEVGKDGVLDNLVTTLDTRLLGLGHQTTHTRQLSDLVFRTTGTRVKHHEYRVEALLVGSDLLHQLVSEFGIDIGPDIDDLVVTLVVGDSTHVIVHLDLVGTGIALGDDFGLAVGDEHIVQVERQPPLECHVVAHVLDIVKELGRAGHTATADDAGDDIAQRLLGDQLVNVADLVGHRLIKDDASHRSFLDEFLFVLAVFVHHVDNDTDDGVHGHFTLVVGHKSLFGAVELEALALVALAQLGDIIETEYHIL